MRLKLGNFFGSRETLYNEFKEFCIRGELCEAIFSCDEIKSVLTTGIIKNPKDFNILIINSLKSYIDWYLPKYFCSFLNAQIKGTIYIGNNDYGEYTGIPFFGLPDNSLINDMINSALDSNVYEFSKQNNFTINIQLNKLDIDPHILDNDELDSLWSQYKNKNSENIRKMDEFNAKKRLWLDRISRYETKLITILNTHDIREELVDYISVYAQELVPCNKLQEFYEILRTKEYIDIDSEIIDEVKTDKKTLLYWVMSFKDHMLQKLLEIRPVRPKILLQTYPEMIFKRLTPLRKLLSQNNKDINYYILKIEIKPNSTKLIDSCSYYFRFPGQTAWNSKVRRCIKLNDDDLTPVCI